MLKFIPFCATWLLLVVSLLSGILDEISIGDGVACQIADNAILENKGPSQSLTERNTVEEL